MIFYVELLFQAQLRREQLVQKDCYIIFFFLQCSLCFSISPCKWLMSSIFKHDILHFSYNGYFFPVVFLLKFEAFFFFLLKSWYHNLRICC